MTARFLTLALACTTLWASVSLAEADPSITTAAAGKELIYSRCVGCHTQDAAGKLSRISEQRKTPEGWEMTLTRMQHNHGLVLNDYEKDAVVKYLADGQGLAPSEAAPFRYALERRNNTIEQYNAINRPDGAGVAMRCTVCHSYARVALQRRTEAEWNLLVHFHVAQYPSIEYHPASRVSAWWQQVEPKMPGVLATLYPLSDADWNAWRQRTSPDLSGQWRIVGHYPGVGFFSGTRNIKRVAPDMYETSTSWNFADGHQETRDGTAVIYTGYEWRGRTNVRREDIREVLAATATGDELAGRWFLSRHSEFGAEFTAVKIQPGVSRVLAVEPYGIKAGTRQRVTIYGINLAGTPDFGPDVHGQVVSQSADEIVVDLVTADSAAPTIRTAEVGAATSAATLTVYKTIDQVRVAPDYAFTRLGEGGGKIPFVGAQFEAIAYASVRDTSGKESDVAVGVLPATWTLEPATPLAKDWEDQLYAGRITAVGQFIPAQGGINPLRTKGTSNNSGDLNVRASVEVDGLKHEATSHLIVSTGMLFFNTPIR